MWLTSVALATLPLQLTTQILTPVGLQQTRHQEKHSSNFPSSQASAQGTHHHVSSHALRDVTTRTQDKVGDTWGGRSANEDVGSSTSTRESVMAGSQAGPRKQINVTALVKEQAAWPPFFTAEDPMNYCGDTLEHATDTLGPSAADCASLKGIVDFEPGYWDVTANAGGSGYILVTSHGTCGFVVKPWNPTTDLLIGSQDVSDLLHDAVTYFPNNRTYSNMSCAPGDTMTFWAIINVDEVE